MRFDARVNRNAFGKMPWNSSIRPGALTRRSPWAVLFLCLCTAVIAEAQDYARMVDTRIGTEQRNVRDGLACGYTYVGATWPFGMVQFTPSYFSPQKGFVINQLSGAGCAHLGNFPVIPVAGAIQGSPGDMKGFDRYQSVKEAYAGYLAVDMPDGTMAELTVSERAGWARFDFPKAQEAGTVIIGSGVNGTFVKDAEVRITSDSSLHGWSEGGEFCGTKTNYRVYFAAEFDRPAVEKGTWEKRKLKKKKSACGKDSGAWFTFDTQDQETVGYRIAISYVSVENAKANLRSDGADLDFGQCSEQAERAWNDALGRIRVATADQDRLVQFYTHLYRSLIHPNIVSDVNGEYMGADFKVHVDREREHYSSFSVWDTYRTQGQLVAMLFPEESSDMMQSLVDFADQAGGFGRWILANIETGIMQGDPTAILVVNSWAFGADDFDLERAYHHLKRGATVPQLKSQEQEVRPHLSEYMRDGHTFASMSLEYNSADFAIGQFARHAVDEEKDAAYFLERARGWKNIYNPKKNWLNSRYPNGVWKDISHDWREGTYVNYFWMVPHDLENLIDTIGGKEFAEQRLDEFFRRLDAGYHDKWFMSGNEPDFQAPWIYNWTNSPWKTSDVIRRVMEEMYDSGPAGLPGNEDLGAMGAWYVFASIGLYPMVPGVGGFALSTPQFERIEIELPRGTVYINGGGPGRYTSSLTLHGQKYTKAWLDWTYIQNGAFLDYSTTEKPDTSWGTAQPPPAYYK
jgi:predicted alpha-1,2-mannosidase